MLPNPGELDAIIDRALAEDSVGADVTTAALIPPHLEARAALVPKEPGVLAGLEVAAAVFRRVDPDLSFVQHLLDGDRVEGGESVAVVSGCMGSILTAERTALNFLQRMSGIATLTSEYVKAIEGTTAAIADTRKTAPGLRLLDKYAVSIGGGRNHRMSLSDGVLIKDNHLAALQAEGISLAQVIKRARARAPHTVKIEIEVESVAAAAVAADTGADIVMLDNMSPADMRTAVDQVGANCTVEASGGITLANVVDVAQSGVDIISVGALTHSARAIDISLDYETRHT
ncbi:MAG: carboxylating nicotinate-nucleotide diphosphorylase [Dehalococcoidia bacterium]|jgi:nicotinate-nucleotide pyrophosphorylase (carboxylating)|nr:carboxylating nicotinate-nucleotide diphosphorylase [Dehalococcoidia bacterium]